MNLLIHLRVIGVLMFVLIGANLVVPGRYRWKEEMAGLSLLNRQIFQVHCFFILLVLGLMGALLTGFAPQLVDGSALGRAVLIGLMVFWGARMLAQWFFYSPTIWRGNRFETAVHGIFSILWVYFTGTFAWAAFGH